MMFMKYDIYEPADHAGERLQTYTLDRATSGIGWVEGV
jgi:hypothetical protein